MGVSGSGKSTLAACLAKRLGCPAIEGDDYHAAASIAKMRAGHPLDDADRWPWLYRLGGTIGAAVARDGIAVAACSALKRSYRERLAAAAGVPLRFVLLDGTHDEIAARLATRTAHYMPATLLDSQFAALERPGADEDALILPASRSAEESCTDVLDWVVAMPEPGSRAWRQV
nr:gluconokinase [Sphingomonas sp. ZFBP2030]